MSLPTKAVQVIFENLPKGEVVTDVSKSDSTFKVKETTLDTNLKEGELLVKALYFSNDPTQRTWLRKNGNNARSYLPPVYEGNVMQSFGLAEVVESKSSNFTKGDVVNAKIPWADYAVISDALVFNKIDKSADVPLPYYLSVLGMTSLTAFFGLTEVGGLKKYLDEKPKELTVCVSAASGAVGSTVVQLAKHLLGATKVIGISGSDEKCKWVESLGADLCVNYKDEDYQDKIVKFLDGGFIDVYFDNVGGKILSFVLTHMSKFGRVAACGAISGYNNPEAAKVDTWFTIITTCLTVQGFLVFNYKDQFPEAVKILTKALKEKKLNVGKDAINVESLEGADTKEKFAEIPRIWNQLFDGEKPTGKLIIKAD